MLQQGMVLAMAPVQLLCLGLLLNMEQRAPKEDILFSPVQIKSQDMARVHTNLGLGKHSQDLQVGHRL